MTQSIAAMTVAATTGGQIRRARIDAVGPDGTLLVELPETTTRLECDLLQPQSREFRPVPGLEVLVVVPPSPDERGCVLGAIGRHMTGSEVQKENETGEDNGNIRYKSIELVADDKLVLRCGEGQISIDKDGTVIIKGARVLSRAKGVNKIKGAAIQIN